LPTALYVDNGRVYSSTQLNAACATLGIQRIQTAPYAPQANGDIEASNGGLKRAIEQHLLLRGSRDFDDVEAYEAFLGPIMGKRNQSRQARLAEELAAMKPLTATPLVQYSEVRVRVSQGSLIRVAKNHYSVPTNLIGQWVKVRVHEWHVQVYYEQKLVDTLPRLVGKQQHHINYRHVIDSLLRKPGGFRDYRYREALFPSLVFRRAWEQLNLWQAPRKADLTYLRVLHLAARTLEADVTQALEHLLASGERWDETDVERLVQPEPPAVPQMTCGQVCLNCYDQLLQEGGYEHA